jgi:AraC-like DNA-binding protein
VTRSTVPTAMVRFILGGFQTLGADPGALARQAGLPVWALGDNTARLPRAQLASLLQAGRAQLADPRLGCHLGCQYRYGALHLYDYLFGTAATLGEALAVGRRYNAICDGDGPAEIGMAEEHDGVTGVHAVRQDVDPDISALMSTVGLSILVTRARQLLEREITPLHVGLASAAPASHRDLVEALGTRRIDFGQDRSTITFARADLGLPMPGADTELAVLLRRRADALIASPGTPARWIDRFRQILAAGLAARDLSLSAAARQLGMSPRTLQRRLEEEGTSWRGEADALRREQASRLAGEGLSRADVAACLGYSDARALRRAARRWDAGGGPWGH